MKKPRPVVVIVGSAPNGSRVRAVARWVRALVPAAALVVSSPGAAESQPWDEAIVVDADALPSGPLSLAVVLAQRHDA
jgi:hypothetical protein